MSHATRTQAGTLPIGELWADAARAVDDVCGARRVPCARWHRMGAGGCGSGLARLLRARPAVHERDGDEARCEDQGVPDVGGERGG